MSTTPSDRLDFWSFVDLAKRRLSDEFGVSNVRATEVLLSLNRASGVVTYDLESVVHRANGGSWATFRIMYVLWLAGPMESRKLAELTGMSRAAVSNLTGPMVKFGLLSRESHDKDGRSVILGLTDLGREEIAAIFARHHRREIEWVSKLDPDEQQTLVRLLNKLVSNRDDFEIALRR